MKVRLVDKISTENSNHEYWGPSRDVELSINSSTDIICLVDKSGNTKYFMYDRDWSNNIDKINVYVETDKVSIVKELKHG